MAIPATTSTTTGTTTSRTRRTVPMPQTFGRMRVLFGAFMGVLALAAVSPSPAQEGEPLRATPEGRPLVLAFSEEFDTFRPWRGRSGVWRTTFGDGTHTGLDRRSLPPNGELQLYVDPDISGPRGS